VQFGVMAALDDSPRPGQEPKITDDAKAWVVSLALVQRSILDGLQND
jgi:hypothetical protein